MHLCLVASGLLLSELSFLDRKQKTNWVVSSVAVVLTADEVAVAVVVVVEGVS